MLFLSRSERVSTVPALPSTSLYAQHLQFMMYIRMIMGSSLVSIFLLIFASATMRCSGDIAATSGGGTSLPCEAPESIAVCATSSEMRSVAALWSRSVVVAMAWCATRTVSRQRSTKQFKRGAGAKRLLIQSFVYRSGRDVGRNVRRSRPETMVIYVHFPRRGGWRVVSRV
jgi:hypothetical protein